MTAISAPPPPLAAGVLITGPIVSTGPTPSTYTGPTLHYLEFDKHVSPRQLRAITPQLTNTNLTLVGYRYENSDIVGEFFINHGDTSEGFSQRFREKFGTDPEISTAIYPVENNAPIPIAEPLSLSGERRLVALYPGCAVRVRQQQLVRGSRTLRLGHLVHKPQHVFIRKNIVRLQRAR